MLPKYLLALLATTLAAPLDSPVEHAIERDADPNTNPGAELLADRDIANISARYGDPVHVNVNDCPWPYGLYKYATIEVKGKTVGQWRLFYTKRSAGSFCLLVHNWTGDKMHMIASLSPYGIGKDDGQYTTFAGSIRVSNCAAEGWVWVSTLIGAGYYRNWIPIPGNWNNDGV